MKNLATNMLAICALLCIAAVTIGCNNAAAAPPAPPQAGDTYEGTAVLSAEFADSGKTWTFSLNKYEGSIPSQGAIVTGKLHSSALDKTFGLKGILDNSGDFTLSFQSNADDIQVTISGKTDVPEVKLALKNKTGENWTEAAPISAERGSIKTGTNAVAVSGTVDMTKQNEGLPSVVLGVWRSSPTYCNSSGGYTRVLVGFMVPTYSSLKTSEPYYAMCSPRDNSWLVYKKEVIDGKEVFWRLKEQNPSLDSDKMEADEWPDYAATLEYFTLNDAQYMTTALPTLTPFSIKVSTEVTGMPGKISEEELEKLKEQSKTPQEISMTEVTKKGDGYDVILPAGANYFKGNFTVSNTSLKRRLYIVDKATGAQVVTTIEEARALTELDHEISTEVFTR